LHQLGILTERRRRPIARDGHFADFALQCGDFTLQIGQLNVDALEEFGPVQVGKEA